MAFAVIRYTHLCHLSHKPRYRNVDVINVADEHEALRLLQLFQWRDQ